MLQTQHNETVEQRLDDAVTAYLEAAESGGAPSRQEWLARYPDLAEGLSTFFADTDRVRCWTDPLCQAVADVSPWKPASFGDYELVAEIGRGGKGVVYEARQISLNRTVALKMVRIDQLGEDIERRRLRNEAETAARLDHPCVLPVYDVGERDGQLYFSMKLLPGGSLADRLAEFKAQPRRAAEVVAVVARAIHHAHQRGVLHRDLKPSNILLDAEGQPHIGDFGLARRLEGDSDLTQTGAILGTPSYMAPEQTVGDRNGVTTAADVYGLGGILYALLTGRPPFVASSVFETMMQVREQAPLSPERRNPRVDRDLATICLKCLQKVPSQRYESALAVAEDLERYLAGQPIVARPVGVSKRTWLWARRQPAAAALVVLAVLAVVGTIAGVLVHNAKLNRAAAEARQGYALADDRYQSARDTLGRMLNQLKHSSMGDVPRLQELRQRLLEDALTFYESALEQANPDPVVRRDAAFAYTEAGAVESFLGQPERANEQFRRAIDLIEGLPAEYRDRPECRDQLTVCHSHLGMSALVGGHFEEAERCYLAERSLCEQLCRDEPGSAGRQNELARAEHHLGRVYLATQRLPEALAHYLRAIEIRTALVREHPEIEAYQGQLAETYINLGVTYANLSRTKEERAAGAKAIALLGPLVERHPKMLEWKMSLAGAYANMGNRLKEEGKAREALKLLDRAVELAEAALRQEPRHNVAQEQSYTAHGARAQVHESLKDWPAAVRDWDRVVALDHRPNPWARRNLRAVTLARSSDFTRATAEARAMEGDPAINGDGLYNLALTYALSSTAVRSNSKLPASKRDALAEDYEARAVAVLQRLQDQGYFKIGDNAKELAEDEGMRVLHGRADFQKLLKQVEARKK
jgi:tetratricopeptide (TPR) repeat protein/tRNA A-37 threonylcarbamoyl transferase component Bud32